MFVSLNIVKGKDRAVAGRQLTNGFVEGYAIHNRHRIGVFRAFDYLYRRFAIVSSLLHLDATFAKVHQDLVDGQPVQPGGKGRFTTKAPNFSKELNEDFLSEVLSLRDVAGHSQTERIDPAIVTLVKLLKGRHVALRSFLRQRVIRLLLRLDFGCRHVFVLGQSYERSTFTLFATITTSPRVSKERQPFFLDISPAGSYEALVALNAGVMRRFERVVALPDPKDIEFPKPQQHFPSTIASGPIGTIE